jgi:hypothetical protein
MKIQTVSKITHTLPLMDMVCISWSNVSMTVTVATRSSEVREEMPVLRGVLFAMKMIGIES